jgi:hypothetical protein
MIQEKHQIQSNPGAGMQVARSCYHDFTQTLQLSVSESHYSLTSPLPTAPLRNILVASRMCNVCCAAAIPESIFFVKQSAFVLHRASCLQNSTAMFTRHRDLILRDTFIEFGAKFQFVEAKR